MDNTVPTVKRQVETVYDPRPKAILKPKVIAQPVKPFIAQGIGSLNRVAGINKGAAVLEADTVLDYETGDRVRHIKYGEGTVLNIQREPKDYKVTVDFDNAGQKIMYASFAKLKRV
jgi:DNA helicase-2/ATP-dependent DNA helicase PcrA